MEADVDVGELVDT